jgi:hypothetical protein
LPEWPHGHPLSRPPRPGLLRRRRLRPAQRPRASARACAWASTSPNAASTSTA